MLSLLLFGFVTVSILGYLIINSIINSYVDYRKSRLEFKKHMYELETERIKAYLEALKTISLNLHLFEPTQEGKKLIEACSSGLEDIRLESDPYRER